eukprot:NODE_3475_length_961_cov_25.231415_g3325_i0.p1 GENE.NODE_3475_length_961_cov_25.231415_g3325_i0~~NODE_3475_length_961_cov_25.231415_g3325_i0.p1  ORF type:complete len:299 (+),score=75.36 NODE_3475_length_961_cov_25.231415_g3325_i0:1-897(+)
MKSSILAVAGGVVICVGILLTCILLPLSFHKVNHDELGIQYGTLTKVIQPTAKEEGLHFIGPAQVIIKYKRTLLTVDSTGANDLPCLSADGIEARMDVHVQYQLKKSELFDVLKEFGDQAHIEEYCKSIARNLLRDVCSEFTAENFYFQRDNVQVRMLEVLKEGFPLAKTHSVVHLVQLLTVQLPVQITTAIENTQLAIQDFEKAQNEHNMTIIAALTDYKTAEKDNEIVLIKAAAQVHSVEARTMEQVLQVQRFWAERQRGFVSIALSLNLTGENFVNSYLPTLVMEAAASPTVALP